MDRTPDRIATEIDPPCAVADCLNAGRPQICPYDQKYHRHGHIHYETIPSALTFREGWEYICDTHYAVLTQELEQTRADRVRDQLSKALFG